ncbi:uncharacterized protein BYT42DRAFT_494036 [Radiomyces spectabilis]|uniref:uncharacterized protein n=1 Tax=Radiomyces spectabilis TaxID=64574 RepID=UPI00221FA818|nr:uncharacterized protein BYT42DRAFT_494036 [Radiomyces spectabilis]KAI8380989.1 hypothetical protein BYT42DRAFT_494036 [Radiomyces spectabilis]
MLTWNKIKTPLMFMYSCFFKPLGDHGANLQNRLESFYRDQANIYDASRGSLLRGRKTMLRLCSAQLKEQLAQQTGAKIKPVWIDLGGGTGWNIEQMNEWFPIDQFAKVILVDLTPSLCQVARQRFKEKGWANVTVLCQDAATFQLPDNEHGLEGTIDLVTMSYSLSMMDHFYPVVDRVQSLLSPQGIVGVVDFYVSGRSAAAAEQWSPQHNRQCNWFTRFFWNVWFDFDHINLSPGRRDYLEYRFGTIKTLNRRNHFIIPYAIQIPYYVWLGCSKARQSMMHSPVSDDNVSISSSRSSASDSSLQQGFSPTSFSLQSNPWRLDYDNALPQHTQFRSYIYAFTWEDPRVDLQHMSIGKEDILFVITSAGDNALEYAIQGQPKRIHCVDMNPCQNHLMELKLAGIASLSYHDFWRMFGQGRHSGFPRLLHEILSPHLSPYALQYWVQHTDRFASKFYKTGYSGLALTLIEWWLKMNGLLEDARKMATTSSMEEQKTIWETRVRPAIFSPMIRTAMDNPLFMWNALGVPKNQMKMFLSECTTEEYVANTLDPIAHQSLISGDQYFYYLCLMQHYHPDNCPSYLTQQGFHTLKTSGALGAFRLHTDSILNALQSLDDDYLTRLVVMDHMDWFDEAHCEELEQEVMHMARTLKKGGHVYWRSASRQPWYNTLFQKHGFSRVEGLSVRQTGTMIDRVNMYASFYRAIK